MRVFFTLLILINAVNLFSQKIEMYGGPNYNKFYNNNISGDPNNTFKHKSEFGYTLGIGLDSIKYEWTTFRFTLQFDKYGGNFIASQGGLGGGNITQAKINKSVISLGVFPVNFRIKKRLNINLGFVLSGFINESFSGTNTIWSMNQPTVIHNLHDEFSRYSSSIYFGLQGRIAYDINLTKSIMISPQYLYYIGFSDEFIQFPAETKSMRHYFCIGIKKKLK